MLSHFRKVICYLCVVTTLHLLGACAQSNLLTTGIGDQAYTPGLTEKRITDVHDYFDMICAKRVKSVSCKPDGDWFNVITASMNDVDERCSLYLDSLYTARRNKQAWDAALTDASASTSSILALTNPASIKAINIIAAAFDYGKSSVSDYYSAVILTEDPSIVEQIVRKLQTQYRNTFITNANTNLAALDRGTAHYVVRGYLRLCLPITIEAELKSIKLNVNYTATGTRNTTPAVAPVLKVLDAMP